MTSPTAVAGADVEIPEIVAGLGGAGVVGAVWAWLTRREGARDARLNAWYEDLAERVRDLEADNAELRTMVVELQVENRALRVENDRLRGENTTLHAEVDGLTHRLDRFEHDSESL